jgi:hypothetical protein
MTALTLTQLNGSQASKPMDSWLQSSVRDFFTNLNWEDHPPDVQVAAQPLDTPIAETLNFGMSVCKFFASFNWDGAEIAAPVSVEVLPTASESGFTLDDFSGLF